MPNDVEEWRAPKGAAQARARIDAALSAFARGDIAHWAPPLGDNLTSAARRLGRLWSPPLPVAPELRAAMAPHLTCAAGDLTTYARLVRRLMRALPAAFAAEARVRAPGSDRLLDELLGNSHVALVHAAASDGRGRRHLVTSSARARK